MSKKIPFESKYKTARKFEYAANLSLIISASLIFILWLAPQLPFPVEIRSTLSPVKDLIKVCSYATMLSYMALLLIGKFIFKSAEKAKRDDLIDNSFGTTFSDESSQGYYNNEDLDVGPVKLAVNAYESSFHTECTLRHMLFKNSIKALMFSIPFLLSIFSENGQSIVRLLFEISIPMITLIQLVTILGYYNSVKNLNDRFRSDLMGMDQKNINLSDQSKLLIPVMEYYNVKSWANINLDKDFFEKNREQLSKKWDIRKERLNIK
jgi:hypothetical protein